MGSIARESQAAPALRRVTLNTAALPAASRLQVWEETLQHTFGPCRIVPDGLDELSGTLRCSERLGVQISELSYRGQVVERRSAEVARVKDEYFTLGVPIAGGLTARSGGREVVIAPGAVHLVNQCTNYRASTRNGYRSRSIVIAADALRRREPRLDPYYRVALDEHTPRAAMLVHFLGHLEAGMASWSDTEFMSLVESLTDLVALLVIRQGRAWLSQAEGSVRLAHRERALAYIRQHLSNPALRPEGVAQGLGVSLRYLHEVFRHSGSSVEQCIYAERVKAACSLMQQVTQQAAQKQRTIAQIAAQVGFAQAAHFSRSFKAQTGLSPRAFRERLGEAVVRGNGS